MPAYGSHRFTVYDAMEARGMFAKNPANAGARAEDGTHISEWPVQFPRMVYHPMGAERVIVPAELVQHGPGWREVGEQKEIISRTVRNKDELEALVAEGWHLHPAKAMTAAGKEAPPTGHQEHVDDLQGTIAELQRQVAALQAGMVTATPAPPLPGVDSNAPQLSAKAAAKQAAGLLNS